MTILSAGRFGSNGYASWSSSTFINLVSHLINDLLMLVFFQIVGIRIGLFVGSLRARSRKTNRDASPLEVLSTERCKYMLSVNQ